jgi:hypothetical protein
MVLPLSLVFPSGLKDDSSDILKFVKPLRHKYRQIQHIHLIVRRLGPVRLNIASRSMYAIIAEQLSSRKHLSP